MIVVATHKVARHVRALATNWALTIQIGTARHREFLDKLSRDMARSCRKATHKRRPALEYRLAEALAKPSA